MKNKFNFKSIILTFTLLTLGVGQMWATDYYFRHWDANNSTQLVDQGSNIYSSYFILSGNISFKVSDASWTNANTFGKSSSAISLNSEYSCASPGSDFSLNFATNRAYLVRLNASGSTKKLLISTFVPSAAAPSAVVSGTNAMFYIQGYEGLNYLVNSSKTKASDSYPMNYTGISYVNTAITNLSTYDRISNNPGDWNGDEATNIKSAKGGELITRANAKTAAKTASTTASVTGETLSISTTTNSTTGVYGSLPLYIQYYIDGTFVGVTYSASTASYGSIPAGGATARASTFDVSELSSGTHTLKTVLTDGIIFWVADSDDFEVTSAVTNNINVTSAQGGSVTTPAGGKHSDVTVDTWYNIAATNTGYNFVNWTKASGDASVSFESSTSASTRVKLTSAGTATVQANWSEVKSTVTVNANQTSMGTLKFGSSSKSWGTTASVGVATTQSITATANSGYVFDRWVLSGGAASPTTLTNATITLKANGSGSAGTAKAVFGKTYYYRGDKNNNGATLMTRHESGYYAYYSTSGTHKFKCAATTDSWDYNTYDNSYGNITLTDANDGYGNVYCPESGSHYICILYPGTDVNDGANPLIFASTTLPELAPEATTYATTFYAGDHGAINAKGTAIAKNGNSSVNIGATARALTATPESGYSFDKWVTTGSVTVADIYSASTTVSASAAGGTVRAHYLANSGWYMVGDPFDNSWTTTNYPMDRTYRGISGVYYRPWTISTSGQYYKVAYNGTQYGQKEAGDDVAVVTGTQYSLVATEAYNTAFKTNNNGSVWCVVDDSNKKFWVQSPGTYHTVSVSNEGSGARGTVTLKEKSYGGLETYQFANGETIRVEIDTLEHYSINTVTLSWGVSSSTTVSMSKSGTKYVGDVVMPNSDATLTVTYTPWYTIHYDRVPTAGGKTAPWANTSGNIDHKTITSDATYVISGTTVYLYAANKSDGYTYYGWYSVNNPSKDDTSKRLTNRQDYSTSITTSGKEFYAIYFENDYEVTVNAGTGGKVNSLSSTSITGHVTSLANLPTATADPGYYFVNWTTTAGTLTNSTSATNGKINGLTSTATVTANFAPIWTIAGLGGDWNTNKLPLATMYVYDAVNYAYLDIDTLRPNTTYYFKAIQRSQGDPVWWHAENTTDNKDIYYSNSNTRINMSSSDGDNFYLHTAGTGTYTFDVNLDGSKHPIKVHFPTSYTVTFGSAHGTVTATVEDASAITSGQYAAAGKDITFAQTPATGYTFKGWYNAESGGTAISCMASDNVYDDIAGNISVYAQYDPKTYDVTLTNSGTGYSSGGQAKLTATYDAAFPSITLPTAANGYAFMGYWSAANGEGTQFTNASGVLLANITDYSDESGHWKYDASDLTLYAYYKKAEITEITLNQSIFEPVASGTSYVKAEPTIEPTPVAPTKICWELLYDNDNPVTSHYAEDDSEVGHENRVKFNLAGLAAGSYRIRATLYTGTECSGGTLLSTYDKTVTIANEFTVTVKYMCGTEEIQASTTTPGKATQWTSISAPDIFGYTFDRWDLGDGGITKHESDAITKQSDFRFKASYNGILTAKYTKNKYIYLDLSNTFSSSGQWNNPYCYLYNSDGYWDDSNGAGATGPNCVKKGAMTQIGSTNIWYYDYSDASTFVDKLAFTWDDKRTHDNFCEDAIYRSDFSEGTPLFIPAVGQTGVKKNSNCATYYNAGYWTNYTGSKTGYTLLIYNSSGTGDPIKTRLFTSTSNDMRMTMKATVDLEAATTYKVEILRDNGHYYKNSDERNYGNSQVNKKYLESGTKGNIVTTAAGDYVFTLSYTDNNSDKDFQIRMIVDYPAAVNDFQVMYNDNATWSLGTAHTEGWRHPSRMIKARAGGVDTISFFVGKTNSPKLYARKVTNASSLTWASLNIAGAASMSLSVDSSAVYNFKVTQSTAGVIASIENIGAYTGEYYIRCDAVNSKWDNYTTDDDHRMTYSSFSESDANAFGEKYSHYKAKWCKYGKNVKFVIANDYSPCISDTLVQDVPDTYENINEDGFLKNDGTEEETENIYSANIRFMWNRKTNKVSRAYVASSTNASRLFLVLRGNTAIKGLDDSTIEDEGSGIPSVILQDDQNWIYEEVLYIKPNTRFKLYACYAQVTASPNGAQYFRGTYNGNAFSGEDGKDSENSVVLIGGSGETYQKARVLYDFKTNRLICAWLPSSSAIDEKIGINADVMVIREHHEPAQYISFKDEDSKLTGVKTVYGVMKFNRWVLNNRKQTGTHGPLDVGNQKSIYERSLYFVSFPFDVRVGDIFGFGRYWDEWYLEYYDGLTRAKNGFWLDSPPNWKYVTPEMATDYVLKANVGYILGLDLDFMAYDNTTFWAHDIETIELFFPSTVAQETLQQVNCTIPALSAIEGDPYRCTINRGDGTEGDRRVKDSYWHCMGVPSFNIYNTPLKDASGTAITWQPSGNTLPFIYMWNKADNTLTAQSTSTFTFLPMHAYLVQNGGEIRWENVSAKGPSSIVARRVNEQPVKEYEWRLALMSDTNLIDQTYVKMSNLEQVTDTFDFNQDLIKEFNKTRSNIYSYIGYEQVAANSMPLQTEQTTVIPVGVKILSAGDYTFAMPEGTMGVGITLIDTETGVRTSLGLMDYTVTLTAGLFNQRFFLEISPVSNVATGLEPTSDSSLKGREGAEKRLIDNKLFIITEDGKVFDARGAMVKSNE